MKKALFSLLAMLPFFGICACGSSESVSSSKDTGCTPQTCLVYAVYSQAGIGDLGYQDLVYYGASLAKESFHFTLENVHPDSKKTAEDLIKVFFDESDSGTYTQRLLLVSSTDFNSLFAKHSKWKQNDKNTILILGNRENNIDAHFWDISLFGASYLAGRTVKDMGLDSAIVLAANPKTQSIQDAVNGFIKGYKKSKGSFDTDNNLLYLSENEGEGFDSQLPYFYAAFTTSFEEPTFIFPAMGGSNLNLFRFIQETKDSLDILSCGMDADQGYINDKIAFSIEKKIDKLVMDFTEKWAGGQALENDFFATFDTKYVDIVVSSGYENWESHFNKFEDEAVKAERAYLEEK